MEPPRTIIAPENHKATVVITDEEKVKEIIDRMKADGPEHLCLITDFDHTLTRDRAHGEWAHSCFSAISHSELISERYHARNKERYKKYRTEEQ